MSNVQVNNKLVQNEELYIYTFGVDGCCLLYEYIVLESSTLFGIKYLSRKLYPEIQKFVLTRSYKTYTYIAGNGWLWYLVYNTRKQLSV